MFNKLHFALIIFSEDLLYVSSVSGKFNLIENDVLIEQCTAFSDFQILINDLIKEGFNEINILIDPRISFDDYLNIEKNLKYNHSTKNIKMIEESDLFMLTNQ